MASSVIVGRWLDALGWLREQGHVTFVDPPFWNSPEWLVTMDERLA